MKIFDTIFSFEYDGKVYPIKTNSAVIDGNIVLGLSDDEAILSSLTTEDMVSLSDCQYDPFLLKCAISFLPPRQKHLALHHPKVRVRKKNMNRCLNYQL